MEAKTSHLALFLPSLGGGGAEGVLATLATGLAGRGLRVDLVLARAEGPYLSRVGPGVRVVDLKARRVLTSLPGLIAYLRRERPDAMLSTLEHANLIALWARRLAGGRTRLVIREANTISQVAGGDTSVMGRLLPHFMRRCYPWADALVAVSQGAADDLAQTIGIPRQRIRVIYNPVATADVLVRAQEPLAHPWFMPGEPPVVLGVGRLTRQKDFPTLVRAFAYVRTRCQARLLILGEGEARPDLEALVRQIALTEDISLPGFADNPYAYMARAAVFVLCSAWEGLPNVLIQAMACGCPVVSTDCPSGPREVLAGGRLGRLVPVGDAEALAGAILETLDSPLPAHVLQSQVAQFSEERIVGQYLDALSNMRRPVAPAMGLAE